MDFRNRRRLFSSVLAFEKFQAASLPLTLLHPESYVAMATTSFVCHSILPAPLHLGVVAFTLHNGDRWIKIHCVFSYPLLSSPECGKTLLPGHCGTNLSVCVSEFIREAGNATSSPLRTSKLVKCGHTTSEYFLSVFLTPTSVRISLTHSFAAAFQIGERKSSLSQGWPRRALLSSKKINH